MEKIRSFTNYLRYAFSVTGWWYVLPFTLVGLVLSGVFYIYSPIYMMMDLIRYDIKKILYNDNEGLSGGAQFVKFLVGFLYYMIFAITVVFAALPLAIFYFLAFCCFFVSSLGKVRGNPFVYHTL